MSKKEVTARQIINFFIRRDNEPADYFTLMPLASGGTIAKTLNRLLEDDILETVPDARRSIMLIRLKDYPGRYQDESDKRTV